MKRIDRNRRIARIRRRHAALKQRATIAAAVFVAPADDELTEADRMAEKILP